MGAVLLLSVAVSAAVAVARALTQLLPIGDLILLIIIPDGGPYRLLCQD